MFNLFSKKFLNIFLFHSIFIDREKTRRELFEISSEKAFTADDFRGFIEKRLGDGFVFISPERLFEKNASWRRGKYALITFDDGYYNNINILPILEEYKIPALFFISTANVLERKSFWWDVLFRETRRRGVGKIKIARERQELKKLTHDKIEDHITDFFGKDVFWPVSDIDRPFALDELKDFARNEFVYFGNHTRHHAILTNYSREGMREEILGGEEDLRKIGGKYLKILAYPNGNVSPEVLEIAGETGIELGMTVKENKNKLPLNSKNKLLLGRFVAKL